MHELSELPKELQEEIVANKLACMSDTKERDMHTKVDNLKLQIDEIKNQIVVNQDRPRPPKRALELNNQENELEKEIETVLGHIQEARGCVIQDG